MAEMEHAVTTGVMSTPAYDYRFDEEEAYSPSDAAHDKRVRLWLGGGAAIAVGAGLLLAAVTWLMH